MSFFSFALVTLPLLIPAFLLFRTIARAGPTGTGWHVAATTFLVIALFLTALTALFAHHDSRQYRTDTASYTTSDVITYWESSLSLTLTVLAVGTGWLLSPKVPKGRADRAA